MEDIIKEILKTERHATEIETQAREAVEDMPEETEEEAAKYERELNAAEKERFDEEEREKNRLFSEREHAEDEKFADACERLKRAYEKHGDEWAYALFEGVVKNG